jgi:DNA-binding response OmpR family regulator
MPTCGKRSRHRYYASYEKQFAIDTSGGSHGTSSNKRPVHRITVNAEAASAPSIFLVEDDTRLSELVSRYLGSHGFRVLIADLDGRIADQVRCAMPELVILDLGLPGLDGFAICKELRTTYQDPILILTARDSDIDEVLGLELGADDYVIKPVEPRVLLARIKALLRRRGLQVESQQKTMTFGGLVVETISRSVSVNGRAIGLSRHEFDLLVHLAAHAGEVQSREALFQHLYRREYDGVDRILDIRISHLRKKLGDEPGSAEGIKTIWGQGYLFVPGAW